MLRIFWNLSPQHKLWSSVSHAVRTPSRFEDDSNILLYANKDTAAYLTGNKNFKSEDVTSYEIGYRIIPTTTVSIDMTVYYSKYDNLRDFSYGQASLDNNIISVPLILNNKQSGYTSGFELASHWQSSPRLNWDLSYNYLNQTLNGPNSEQLQSGSPHQNVSLRNNIELSDDIEMNIWLKYTDKFDSSFDKEKEVDNYTTLDARLTWQATKNMNLSLVGQNLLESRHIEYLEDGTNPTEVERGVYIKLLWEF